MSSRPLQFRHLSSLKHMTRNKPAGALNRTLYFGWYCVRWLRFVEHQNRLGVGGEEEQLRSRFLPANYQAASAFFLVVDVLTALLKPTPTPAKKQQPAKAQTISRVEHAGEKTTGRTPSTLLLYFRCPSRPRCVVYSVLYVVESPTFSGGERAYYGGLH